MPDDLILFSEDGAHWLPPRDWLAWLHRNHPERFRDETTPQPPAPLDPIAEGKTWRAGRAQGVLARTSPLAAERAARKRNERSPQ